MTSGNSITKLPLTLTDRARAVTDKYTRTAGKLLHQAGIHPDALTIGGLVIVALAAVLVGMGHLQAGGLLLLLGLPFDVLDGAVARASGRKSMFGALLDSTLDRYADGFIFGGMGYHFAVQDQFGYLLLALCAMIGSFVVSYVRARSESINVPVKIGWFSRFERVILILLGLLVPPLLPLCLWVLAAGTNITGLQRLWFVYRTLAHREGLKHEV